MLSLLNWLIVTVVGWFLRVFRLPGLNSSHLYAALGAPPLQPLLERLGRRRAFDVYRIAQRRCPAYRQFLQDQNAPTPRTPRDFHLLPATTKENYVKKFSIQSRCLHGRIPSRGVVIDESSGSSGVPNNWVRGRTERDSVKRLLQHGFTLSFQGQEVFLLNCFALGPWATGMNISMSLADSVVLKSIGPDKQKLENTLRLFGPEYRYVVAGYPPFIKDFMDTASLDLAPFNLHLVVGGEGISEGLRDYFLRVFKTVHSSYGASDLEINIGAETPTSIALRRSAAADPTLCRDLFGRDDPPMVFQYNPLDYHVERSDQGELVITLLRRGNICPKVRYNIRDIGGSFTHRELTAKLAAHGAAALPRGLAFPFLYVFGRSDLSVPFYGAKVFTTDIDAILNSDPALRATFGSFQIKTGHDAALNEVMTIALELANRPDARAPSDLRDLRQRLFDGLVRVNQDFREVSKMFTPERLAIEVHNFGAGPFAGRDFRVKHKYIA